MKSFTLYSFHLLHDCSRSFIRDCIISFPLNSDFVAHFVLSGTGHSWFCTYCIHRDKCPLAHSVLIFFLVAKLHCQTGRWLLKDFEGSTSSCPAELSLMLHLTLLERRGTTLLPLGLSSKNSDLNLIINMTMTCNAVHNADSSVGGEIS